MYIQMYKWLLNTDLTLSTCGQHRASISCHQHWRDSKHVLNEAKRWEHALDAVPPVNVAMSRRLKVSLDSYQKYFQKLHFDTQLGTAAMHHMIHRDIVRAFISCCQKSTSVAGRSLLVVKNRATWSLTKQIGLGPERLKQGLRNCCADKDWKYALKDLARLGYDCPRIPSGKPAPRVTGDTRI
jgi:hypothetical protein